MQDAKVGANGPAEATIVLHGLELRPDSLLLYGHFWKQRHTVDDRWAVHTFPLIEGTVNYVDVIIHSFRFGRDEAASSRCRTPTQTEHQMPTRLNTIPIRGYPTETTLAHENEALERRSQTPARGQTFPAFHPHIKNRSMPIFRTKLPMSNPAFVERTRKRRAINACTLCRKSKVRCESYSRERLRSARNC